MGPTTTEKKHSLRETNGFASGNSFVLFGEWYARYYNSIEFCIQSDAASVCSTNKQTDGPPLSNGGFIVRGDRPYTAAVSGYGRKYGGVVRTRNPKSTPNKEGDEKRNGPSPPPCYSNKKTESVEISTKNREKTPT